MKMADFAISTSGPFFRTQSGSITGVIFASSDGFDFPEKGWRDFVPIVLGWWLEAVNLLTSDGRCTLNFMDGPYEIRVLREALNVRLTFLSRTVKDDNPEHEIVIAMSLFVRRMVEAGKAAAITLEADGYAIEASALMRAVMAVDQAVR
ncbi:MAG TPA: hypothetical protein VFV49_03460 [Thermoanaerobaculia bacterium]|nr:hypothetical protein [Thermoanaerobaculia bacterium]